MGRVKLGDVVKQIKIKKDPETSGLKYYVAGEHIISDNLKLEKGTIKGSTIGPAFTMYFKPGQVLLMSRRPNLRKMAVADFEGICSNVTYVLESKDQNILTQEYLPFILKSDFFWEFGIKNQRGSTNPYLNWSDYEQYEFDLPDMDEQKRLSKILWAAEEVKQRYAKAIFALNGLKFTLIENSSNNDNLTPLGQIVELCYGKSQKQVVSDEGDIPIYGTGGILGYATESLYDKESILIGRKGTIDRPLYLSDPFWVVDTTYYTKPILEFNVKWLYNYLFYCVDFKKYNEATGVPSLNANVVKGILIPMPDMYVQNYTMTRFAVLENQADNLLYALENISSFQKKLINTLRRDNDV